MLNRNSRCAGFVVTILLFFGSMNNHALGAFSLADLFTYQQGAWGGDPTAMGFLINNYNLLYGGSNFGVVKVGIPGVAGYSLSFTDSGTIIQYLPASGTPAPLTSDYVDPTSSSSGEFGGNVLALRLNIDMSDAGVTQGNLGIPFGDLQLRNFVHSQINLNDLRVRQVLGPANNLLGGGSSLFFDLAELNSIAAELNASFGGGFVSPWAQDHLRVVPGIPGDYNQNGTVDAADYTVWRNMLGQTGSNLAADGNGSNNIDAGDYDVWRANFGKSPGSGAGVGASVAVPEPTSLVLLMLTAAGCCIRRRRKVQKDPTSHWAC